jgi:F420-dependent oxidoreductase-like protein
MIFTMKKKTRLGFQIPNFTYPDVPDDQLFERVATLATTAEQAGFDTVFVMDHFFQLPQIGPPEHEMFEAYTLLAALAARTEKVRLGTLVTGVTYRNPSYLAKQVTALDVISRGRALLGIGAAWFDAEHHALGFEFPPLKERFERLEDALRICTAMFTEKQATVAGTHHSVTEAWNSPAPLSPGGPPIMVGGSGEKKTFRLAAQYADELNMTAGVAEVPQKLAALQGHLDTLGRDRSDIAVSCLHTLVLAPTLGEARAKVERLLRARGVDDPSTIIDDPAAANIWMGRVTWGDPDQVVERVQGLLDLGLDGMVFNMVGSDDPDSVALAGETLTRVLG